jgi:glycosyltransferase involved in cell wall biosynthesis
MKRPYLSFVDFYVLIPCYNNLAGLIRSLQSIVYDPEKFGVLIVDDGSKDPILLSDLHPQVSNDFSIEIIRIDQNQGITKALNKGLQWLAAKDNFRFIARLDCGDVCSPDRFHRQIAFLQNNPTIDLVGSWCLFKDFSTGSSYQYSTPTDHQQIIRGMHFRNIFIHPTVMWKREASQNAGPYPEQFPHAEDYGFFYHILNNGKCAVIPENLVTCEINAGGISLKHRKQQLKSRIKVVKHYGKSNVYSFIGVIKLVILLAVPSKLALFTKHAIYGR